MKNAGMFLTGLFAAPITAGISLAAAGAGLAATNTKGVVYRRNYNATLAEIRRRAA